MQAQIRNSSHSLFSCLLVIACSGKNKEDSEEESEAESAEGDDESDLDLAWKMLDVARAIVEKHSGDTVEKVDILSALAEVALERGSLFGFFKKYFRTHFSTCG